MLNHAAGGKVDDPEIHNSRVRRALKPQCKASRDTARKQQYHQANATRLRHPLLHRLTLYSSTQTRKKPQITNRKLPVTCKGTGASQRGPWPS